MKPGGHLWSAHPHVRSGDQLTFGERSADVMRNAFGSWAFVGGFLLFMAIWMVLNTAVLRQHGFDKYPYILLNLSLSMMAGLQGALILIAAKRADRVAAEQATAHYAETVKLDGLATDTYNLQQQQMTMLAGIEHANAELNLIRQAVAPAAANPAAGTDPAPLPSQPQAKGTMP
jgi:uncharacterized membrane protein